MSKVTRYLGTLVLAVKLFGFVPAVSADVQNNPETAAVDSLFAQYNVPGTPGLAIGVMLDGQLVHTRGFGYADIENDVLIKPESVFDPGSNAKQITATCIFLLEEEGKLSIDDPIQKYIPEFPTYQWPITLRHLLTHTSGLRDYFDLLVLKGENLLSEVSWPEIFKLITSQKGLNFRPGDQQVYCNTGWVLLSNIVGRVSGKSFQEFARERIFDPLGMQNTFFIEDHFRIVKNRTTGYVKMPGSSEYMRTASMMTNVGDGGMLTTVGDWAKWDANFYHNKLGKGNPYLLDKLRTPTILNNGDTAQFSIGLVIEKYRGLTIERHGGAFLGARSEMVRFPEQKFTAIVLANQTGVDVKASCFKIADIYLADKFLDSPAVADASPATPYNVSPDVLADKAGRYRNPITGTVWTVTSADTALAVSTNTGFTLTLLPTGPEQFRLIGPAPTQPTITFQKQENRSYRIKLNSPNQSTMYFEPLLPASGPIDGKLYAGHFHSDEVELDLYVEEADGSLKLRIADIMESVPMSALAEDQFTTPDGGTLLRFERGQGGAEKIYLSTARARDIIFTKHNES